MEKKILLPVVLIFVFTLCRAQITSTFDSGDESWTFSSAITTNPSGGNTGGYISSTYSASATSTSQYWSAPAEFLGNLAVRSLGEDLTFSMQQSLTGTTSISTGDVRIENGGNVLVYNLPAKPALSPLWSTYTIKLDETGGWKFGSSAGAAATRAQIIQVLTNVTAIEFRASYITNASYTAGIDDVIIEQKTLGIAPSITSFSPASAKPETAVTITGNNFDPLPENNVVYFGSVAATINNASSTQLTVTAPLGAVYGSITVINKTTGLASQSATPFIPLFTDGGRIIPASFDPKADISTVENIDGLSVADIDGDGWHDLIMADETNQNFSVYRNLGNGGDLSASSFDAKVTFATGGSSANGAGLRIIDLDGDGKPDAITSANRSSIQGTFVTFRNTSIPGTISFEAPEMWDGLRDESPILNAADIDGDGRPELMGSEGSSSNSSFSYFWIVQNISSPGDIEFAAARNYDFDMFDSVSGASVGDLDNDGKSEIVVKTSFSGAFHVLKNNSVPGEISLSHLFSVTSGIQGGIQIADLNLDGKNDLIWKSGGTSDIRIRINTYSGGTLSATDLSTEVILTSDLGNYGAASLADINGDGKTDIVTVDNGNIGIFENVYSGGAFDANAFVTAYLFQGAGNSTYPTSAIAADLNRDTKPDLVMGVTNTTPNRISLYENKNVHAPVISLNTVSPLSGFVGSTVTITGDYFSIMPSENKVYFGAVEAVVLTATKTELTVSVPAGASYAPVSVRVGQLTARYHLPFSASFSSGVSFNNTHFADPVDFTLTTANYDLDVADLNVDGKPDIIAEASGGTYIFRNTHTSGAISISSLVPDDTLAATFSNPRLEDLDGDGLPDVVAVNGLVRKNSSASDEITFAPNVSIGAGTSNLAYADFNLDGKTDIAFTNVGSAQLLIKENLTIPGDFVTGTFPSFSSGITYAKPSTGGGMATGDFDADGYTDVVTTNPGADNISFFRNLGTTRISSSQFDTRIDMAVADNPGRIYSGDLDVDGKTDLVLYHGTGAGETSITVLHNQSTPGNISFTSFILTMDAISTVAHIDDLDGDGRPEIMVVSEAGDLFSIFKNNSTPGTLNSSSFATPFNTAVANPRSIYTADINLDGKPEIIISAAPNSLLVYENLIPNSIIAIVTQPLSPVNVCEGENINLSVSASGPGVLSYQWQKFDGAVFNNITDGGGYSGATSSVLTVNSTGNFGAGDYRCQISSTSAPDVFSSTAAMSIVAVPAAPATTDASACTSSAITLTASGGTDGDYRWYDVSSGGTAIAGEVNSTITISSIASTASYYVTIDNGTCESARTPVVATAIPLPSAPGVTGDDTCGPGTVTLMASGGSGGLYRWYDVSSGGTAISGETTSILTISSIASTTTYYVAIDDGTCESARTSVLAIVLPIPSAPSVAGDFVCGSGPVSLTASGGTDGQYRWYDGAAGGTALSGEVNNVFTTPSLTATTAYYVSINDGCESERIEVVATVDPIPAAPAVTGASVCAGASANLGASGSSDGNYRWYTTAAGGSPITGEVNSIFTINAFSSTVSYFVSIVSGNCESERTEVTATVIDCADNNPPSINPAPLSTPIGSTITFNLLSIISDADGDLDPESLEITVQPQSGAMASIDENGNLLLDYSAISFVGIDRLTIRACDNTGTCTEEELTIDVTGDIVIYNAISPNGDGLNDIMLLQYIDLVPETQKNRVVLYNRWGDVVFEISDYNNNDRVFKGLSNNGTALPSGTYFYKIEFASGRGSRSGYLVLKQ